MEIQSAKLGTVQIDPALVYTFEPGLLGFEDYRQYALIRPDESMPFAYLQAVEEAGVCLLVTDPFVFCRDYQFKLPDEDVEALGQPSPDQVAVWVTVTARETLQDATINLLAPIILNTSNRQARQVVLHDTGYQTRVPMFPAAKEGK